MPSLRKAAAGSLIVVASCIVIAHVPACRGKRGPSGPTVVINKPPEQPGQTLPGVVLEITAVSQGSGPGRALRSGDRLSITFTIKTSDGEDLAIDSLDLAAAMVSGPTFNYQRVLARQADLPTASVANADGSYTYTFADPLPSTYLAPLNDTASFGSGDGELAGQTLLSGTYTVGLEAFKDYTVGEETQRDAGNATRDFLFGSATTLDSREVVTVSHCNQCHRQLRAHGGIRINNVKMCLLCHTSGAEDHNVDTVENGTPGRTIDSRVMFHKIHDGKHLPSVLGVATNPDGSRNYAATPQPYRLVGSGDEVSDFSAIGFPGWPNLTQPMPRDAGFSSLTTGQQALEDTLREGVTACSKCHGDPDGAGPIDAPAQGSLIYSQPSRRACGSCHDDIDWTVPYAANTQVMQAQADDSGCNASGCHTSSGSSLSPLDAHVHPIEDSALNLGLHVNVTSLVEAGANDGDGTIDPGEKIQVTFSFTDDSGVEVAPSALSAINLVISGPVNNRNLLLSTSILAASLTGSQPFTINVPQSIVLEFVGDATAAANETFTTARTPHLNLTGAATTVRVRTATSGGSTTLAAAIGSQANYIDVVATASFARNDFLVIDDGVVGLEEYLQVLFVDGSRLWLGSPLRAAHASGATAKEVTLTTKTVTTDYTLNAATGAITEVTEFGDGNAVVVSYTSDYLLPDVFPPPLNDSPDLGQSWADWQGLSLLDGTYQLGIWATLTFNVAGYGETTSFRGTSLTARTDFLVGSATDITTYGLISSADNCNTCHIDILFHGAGRRGFDNCILCHGSAGSEDRPRYTAAGAPATTGVAIEFRSMLHKIHRGEELANAATYTVVGFGATAYPNNFSTATYGEVAFPALPGGTKHCTSCHGSSDAWKEPLAREHADATTAARVWYSACTSCHDSTAAAAHADINTSSGTETCSVCHGPDREFSVEVSHRSF